MSALPERRPMAYSFAFDDANQIFLVSFEGRVTDELIVDFYGAAALQIARMPALRGSIVDFSPVAEFAVSSETIREVAWSPPLGGRLAWLAAMRLWVP